MSALQAGNRGQDLRDPVAPERRPCPLFGLIAVFGVVVNDALVLLDRYNTIRLENAMLPASAYSIDAASARMAGCCLSN